MNKLPKLCRHRGSGQGCVYLGGRAIYLGKWPANQRKAPEEVLERYEKTIGEWLASGKIQAAKVKGMANGKPAYTVSEVLAAFMKHALQVYRDSEGNPSRELFVYKRVAKTLREMYGTSMAHEFGPRALAVVRERFVRDGVSRRVVNRFVIKAKAIFRYAASMEMASGSQVADLESLQGLRAGRSEARETLPVSAPDEAVLDAIISKLPFPLKQLANVLKFSGARTGEILSMRAGQVDQSKPVWEYRVERHKTAWRGKDRVVHFGPRCQEVLRPLLDGLAEGDFVFSPARSEQVRLAEVASRRKTPRWPSHQKRNEMKRKKERERQPGERFERCVFARAFRRAAAAVYPMPEELARTEGESLRSWRQRLGPSEAMRAEEFQKRFWPTPHALRHFFGSLVRQRLSLEAAEKVLGHSSPTMAAHYAKLSDGLAASAAASLG